MAFQKKCLDKMNEVSKAQGRTILYVSHNMHTIRQLCQRVIVLEHGRVVFDGGVEDGIAVYMNNVKTEDAFAIDYTEIPRLQWLGPTSVRTLYAEYIGKTDIAFSHGEPMNIRIEWENEADVRELCLRVEIKRADRTAIGFNWLEAFYSGKAGEHGSFSVQVDLSTLVSGKYTTSYTFFFKGMYGEEKVADCVDGLNFTLKDEEALLWNRSAWGEVLFPIRKLETNR